MSENTKIEWADHTFNPVVGCTKISPACDNCYAESWAKRSGLVQWGPHAERRRTSTANWRKPLKWNAQAEAFHAQHGRRQRVFCASLADVFDNQVPVQWRMDLFNDLILETPHLDWLLLTKRIGNVRSMLEEIRLPAVDWLSLPNVWIGATITSQAEADRDIPKLLEVPAAKRFLSMEPLLGPVDLTHIDLGEDDGQDIGGWSHCDAFPVWLNALNGEAFSAERHGQELKGTELSFRMNRLDWVIVGGESGPGARPMHRDWARSLRDQCDAAGVPFMFKQWGEWIPAGQKLSSGGIHTGIREFGYDEAGRCRLHRLGKKATGRMLDGREWNGVPA